jgi:hypothetical protein
MLRPFAVLLWCTVAVFGEVILATILGPAGAIVGAAALLWLISYGAEHTSFSQPEQDVLTREDTRPIMSP